MSIYNVKTLQGRFTENSIKWISKV